MKKINVMQLVNGTQLLGAERVVLEIIEQLPVDTYKVTIGLVNGGEELKQLMFNELSQFNVAITIFSHKYSDFYTMLLIFKYCKKYDIDLLHSHGYKSDIIIYLCRLFGLKINMIATNHTYKVNTLKDRIYRKLDLYALSKIKYIVAVNEDVKSEMVAAGINANKIKIIDNGVSLNFKRDNELISSFRAECGAVDSDSFVVGIVASLTPEKAHGDLLQAMSIINKLYNHIKLVIVGDGLLRKELERKCCDLDIVENVYFAGRRDNVRQLLGSFDVFVLPSYNEGLPMALLEAMASNIPVVASSVGAVPNVIQDGVNGCLIEPGSVEQLVENIKKVFLDVDLRNVLASSGRETIEKKYSSQKMTEKYMAIYREIVI